MDFQQLWQNLSSVHLAWGGALWVVSAFALWQRFKRQELELMRDVQVAMNKKSASEKCEMDGAMFLTLPAAANVAAEQLINTKAAPSTLAFEHSQLANEMMWWRDQFNAWLGFEHYDNAEDIATRYLSLPSAHNEDSAEQLVALLVARMKESGAGSHANNLEHVLACYLDYGEKFRRTGTFELFQAALDNHPDDTLINQLLSLSRATYQSQRATIEMMLNNDEKGDHKAALLFNATLLDYRHHELKAFVEHAFRLAYILGGSDTLTMERVLVLGRKLGTHPILDALARHPNRVELVELADEHNLSVAL